MARAKGRDVLVELLETVAKLEASSNAQATKLEALAVHAVQAAAETTALRLGFAELLQRIGALEAENHELAEGFLGSAKLARTHNQQVGQLTRVVKDLATKSTARLDEIEERVEALERKAG